MSYPGNASLSQEIQERILKTFEQTLELASKGSQQEALLGCDFILRMDPLFQPARTLLDRLNEGDGAVDVSDLRPDSRQSSTAPAAPEPPAAGGDAAFEALHISPEDVAQIVDSLEKDSVEPELQAPAAPGTAPPQESSTGEAAAAAPAQELDQRIQELLDEGRAAFEKSEYQAAIDAWSRIFLIDIDHAEAARRIELARNLKAELERKVEETFHQGVAHFNSGRRDEARQAFEQVQEMQPNHLASQEYLQQIEAGVAPAEAPAPTVAEPTVPELAPPPAEAPGGEAVTGEAFEEVARGQGQGGELLRVPPMARAQAAAPAKPTRSFLTIGSLFLLLVLGGGWLLYSNWSRWFPNAEEQVAAAPAGPSPIQRANRLHLDGQTAQAIAELRRVPPDNPHYDQAQERISQLQEEAVIEEPEEEGEEGEAGPSARDLARRDAYLERARRAYGAQEYLRASRAFQTAAKIQPLEGPVADLYADTQTQLEPIAQQVDLFGQNEWEMILPALWRKLEDDPDNKDARRLLTASYYNLGVRALRRSEPESAAAHFKEVLVLEPEDAAAQRLLRFAETYQQYPEDLLYRILVKHLGLRR